MSEKTEYLKGVLEQTRDFQGMPTYVAFGDGKWFYTEKQLVWNPEGPDVNRLEQTSVQRGFVTDLTSIPRPFWSLLPRDGAYVAAAIIHDWNYWFQKQSREEADEIFDIGMKELNVADATRKLIFQAVRTGGGSSWRNNKKLRASGEKRVLKKFPNSAAVTWDQWKKMDSVFNEDFV